MSFTDKKVVVTGANRGMGLAITKQFLEAGANVIGFVRHPESFPQALSSQWHQKLTLIECDLQKSESIEQAVAELKKQFKQIDVLVNNAGVLYSGAFMMTKISDIREMFDVNFFAPLELSQKIIRLMLKNGGSIVNIASVSAVTYETGTSGYSASKAALASWTKVLAKELGPYKIRVNAICPGVIDTDILNPKPIREAVEKTINEQQIIKRYGQPEEVANAVLFVASDQASYMTGAWLNIDGGTYY